MILPLSVMKTLHFGIKEENNQRREEEFLALTPSERVSLFIKMVAQVHLLPSIAEKEDKGNFVIARPTDKDLLNIQELQRKKHR
jgi:hypothetical protein